MPTDRIARLLQQGLDHYGRNEISEAVRCWKQVLTLAPDNAVARDYLEAAGIDCDPKTTGTRPTLRDAEIIDFGSARANLAGAEARADGSPPGVRSVSPRDSFKAEVAQLLRERRYQSALELLYTASERHPEDAEIARSIELLRDRLELQTQRPSQSNGAPPSIGAASRGRAAPVYNSRAPTVPVMAERESGKPVDGAEAQEDYATLFKRATEAYMVRDFGLAIQLFTQCHEQRPDDRRALHNLNALKRRMRGE